MKQLTCKEWHRSSAWKGYDGRGIFYREKRTKKYPHAASQKTTKKCTRKITGVLEMVSRNWLLSFLYKNPWPPNKASRSKITLQENGSKPVQSSPEDTAETCRGPGRGRISIWYSTLDAWTTSSSEQDSSMDTFTKFTVFIIFPGHPGVAFVGEHMLH